MYDRRRLRSITFPGRHVSGAAKAAQGFVAEPLLSRDITQLVMEEARRSLGPPV